MTHAQFGEDELIDGMLGGRYASHCHLFGEECACDPVPTPGTVVDIGAGDGMEISNSRLFRERGWRTILVEADERHRDALLRLASPTVEVHLLAASPANINHLVPEGTTVLSIDVDGDDIFLLDALEVRPEVIVIEHNPTMPYHRDVQPARPGLRIGSSVAALQRVANAKGYGLAAVTHCNAIFRRGVSDIPMPAYEPAYHVATEYFTGRPVVIGEAPWGVEFGDPYHPGDVIVGHRP